MKNTLTTLVIGAGVLAFSGCESLETAYKDSVDYVSNATASKPVEYKSYEQTLSKELSVAQLQEVIVKSALKFKWTILTNEAGLLTLTLKDQTATITYDTKKITVAQTGGSKDVDKWISRLSSNITLRIIETYPNAPTKK